MHQTTRLTVAARNEDDFDDLMERARNLFGRPPVRCESAGGGTHTTFQAPVLVSFEGDEETLIVTFEFNSMALKLLGVEGGGRDALAAGEAVSVH